MGTETPKQSLADQLSTIEKQKSDELFAVTQELRYSGVSEQDIDTLIKEHTTTQDENSKKDILLKSIHEKYDAKVTHTKEEIERHHYIQDLKRMEKIEKEFPLLERQQKSLPMWRISEIMRIKKQRKEMVETYQKLKRAVSEYQYTDSRRELFK